MRKLFSIMLSGAAMIVLGGCTKELVEETGPETEKAAEGITVVAAGLPSTRTYMGEADADKVRKVYWENEDVININGTASEALENVENGTQSVNFTFPAVLSYPYSALYPASAYKDASTITLAAVQEYRDGTFAQNTLPMAAYATEGAVQFSHICSIVKLSLTLGEDTDEIEYVEFRGNNKEQVSGDFTIDYETLAVTSASTADADKTVKADVRKTLSAGAATEIYIVVPAGEYTKGFTVKVVDVKGHYMEKAKAESCTFTAGKVVAMPEFAFVPTGTEVDVEIATAQELVDFARAYNAGDYSGAELTVSLTADIEFDETTSAAFESIGTDPAGDATNFFNGLFDGNGKKIMGYKGDKPLFAYTGGAGYIKDLTIDETCVYTIDPSSATAEFFFAPLVIRHKGDVVNCHNNANVAISGTVVQKLNIGGLVCRMLDGATVDKSSVSGTISTASDFNISTTMRVGGVVAYSSTATDLIKGSEFKGNINCLGFVKALYVGGVIADIQGKADNCSVAADGGNPVINVVNEIATVGCDAYIGGIAAVANENTTAKTTSQLKKCINNGIIHIGVKSVINDVNIRHFVGGVAGKNNGFIDNCSNNALVEDASVVRRSYFGGIVGDNYKSVENCTNSGAVKMTSPDSPRYLRLGGIIASSEYEISTENTNKGTVSSIGLENNNTGVYANIGGVIGFTNKSVSNVINKGLVSFTPSTKMVNVYMGGIIGQVGGSATISADNATNSGKVSFAPKVKALGHTNICVGGIVGMGKGTPLTISASSNTATVERTADNKVNGCGSFIGGIAGALLNAGSQIIDCNNTSAVREGNFSNSLSETGAPYCGGIVGYISGTEANRASVKNCNNNSGEKAYLYCKRGFLGGVAGRTIYTDVDNCSNTSVTSENISFYIGGITGWSSNSTIINCVAKSTYLHSSGSGLCCGGISAKIDAGTTIGTSKAYNVFDYTGTLTCCGALAGETVEGTSVTNCGWGGTLKGTALTESQLVGTAGATLTGNYAWDGAE